MELTAKEILEKNIKTKLNGASQKLRLLSDCEIELAAMKEIAELAFDKGFDRGIWVEGMREESEPLHKTEFINSLFPESK